MASVYYTVEFDYGDLHYNGRVSPEFRKGQQEPVSWHIVLNDVFYGYLHKNVNHWEVNEQRPQGLTEKLGFIIEQKKFQAEHTD